MTTVIDLQMLPAPDLVEPINIESIYQAILSGYIALNPQFTAAVETDPMVKLMEYVAYREAAMRARINDAARSNYLAFADGADLDHLAAWPAGIERMPGESRERFAYRVQLSQVSLAGTGFREKYILSALGVSTEIVAADARRAAAGGVLVIVWIKDTLTSEEKAAVLSDVEALFASDTGRPLGVPITVKAAQPVPVNLVATVWREPSIPADAAITLQSTLASAINSYASLGRDIPPSWISSRLHVTGIAKVILPAEFSGISVGEDEYAVAGNIQIIDGGVVW